VIHVVALLKELKQHPYKVRSWLAYLSYDLPISELKRSCP
jgi:hypothetical protein